MTNPALLLLNCLRLAIPIPLLVLPPVIAVPPGMRRFREYLVFVHYVHHAMPFSVLASLVVCTEPSSLVSAPGGFWIGKTWYGYKDAVGNIVAKQPEWTAQQAPSKCETGKIVPNQPMAPPGVMAKSMACQAREVESVRHHLAQDMVEQWETGRLSVIRFSLLEATMGEKHLPKCEGALQDLTNRISTSLASMKDLGSGKRKRARSQVLSTIEERERARLEKDTLDGHKSALRAYARFCAVEGELDERIHYAPAVPVSAMVARRRLLLFLEYLYSGGIKFRDDVKCLKTCRRYAMTILATHELLDPPVDLNFLATEVRNWSEDSEKMTFRCCGQAKIFEKSAYDKGEVSRLCRANWCDHIRRGKYSPEILARLDITLKAVVQALYQCMFRRAELLRPRSLFNYRIHPV